MAINEYDRGDVVVLTATFTVAGTGTDPSPLPVLTIKQPDGTPATPTVVQGTVGDGIYTAEFSPTQSGTHYYRWTGLGSAQAAGEGEFLVRVSRVL